MRIPTVRLTFCLLAASAAMSCAGSQGPDISAVDKGFLGGISSYDQNHDGVVTCDEWRAAAANLFTRANKSGSGVLTPEEFQDLAAIDRTFLTANLKYYDTNGDGKVDKKEFIERPNPAFTYADRDKDCKLTRLELATALNLSAPPPQEDKSTFGPNASRTVPTIGSPTGQGGRY